MLPSFLAELFDMFSWLESVNNTSLLFLALSYGVIVLVSGLLPLSRCDLAFENYPTGVSNVFYILFKSKPSFLVRSSILRALWFCLKFSSFPRCFFTYKSKARDFYIALGFDRELKLFVIILLCMYYTSYWLFWRFYKFCVSSDV